MSNFTEMDCYLFGQATHYDIYKKMGAHLMEQDGKEGVCFNVWAPHATAVFVIGDFNGWNESSDQMVRVQPKEMGVYELFVPGVKKGAIYKYLIYTQDGRKLYKADPYANYAQLRPETASVVTDISNFKWTDDAWMKERQEKAKTDLYGQPMAIYEVHFGSWMRHMGREDEGFYTYRELAKSLVSYVKEMGYTHIELMGISEYPFDGSWGYQVTGYYAPTSRYGTPEDFMYFVDYLHQNDIGVILDWVPAHFPKDVNGLGRFDGEALYEDPNPQRGEHPHWGTYVFDYGRKEVSNFLIANALYWVEQYHIDGLRMDAVASMIHLDYGREYGKWSSNIYGSNIHLEAVEFLKHLNSMMKKRNPDVLMIAEESTAYSHVTGDVNKDSLGFDYKWNMGWMNDFLEYMARDPKYRQWDYDKLLFSMMYAYSEQYTLVFSHDEVVHGKGSMIAKMPGEYEEKFANLRLAYGYMTCHPGKKLLFMGQDIGEFDEWNENRSVEWDLLTYEKHQCLNDLVKDLNHFYAKHKALYETDFDHEGYEWINNISANENVIVFQKKSGKEFIV